MGNTLTWQISCSNGISNICATTSASMASHLKSLGLEFSCLYESDVVQVLQLFNNSDYLWCSLRTIRHSFGCIICVSFARYFSPTGCQGDYWQCTSKVHMPWDIWSLYFPDLLDTTSWFQCHWRQAKRALQCGMQGEKQRKNWKSICMGVSVWTLNWRKRLFIWKKSAKLVYPRSLYWFTGRSG